VKDRTGEVWVVPDAAFGLGHTATFVVVGSRPEHLVHRCLILERNHRFQPGEVVAIGEWNDANGWERIA
jgi:hypothetical protein